ncbi:pentapeptide repeat-containing protein [Hyphobacterium marinum]|uniref:Pentapeptide repeat-containing protein n=1 Tax=Hyphobacterium marinum TaxID=3116574 RepID=A0ABU7LX15_9PROT|nr:pentapeptide repeat-containing protein [Hyphobacterium sp. Y6023]MEE2566092.1 pentapeptide repeat-containing protein [Hyphobacterium sp. Y6023]
MNTEDTGPTVNQAAYNTMAALLTAHEKYLRGDGGGRRLAMKFADLSGFTFQNRNFSQAELSGSTMTGAKLAASKFVGTSLFCCNLTEADLRAVDFRRADLRGVILKGANLYGANLDEADFREAMLVRADQKNAFREARSFGRDAEQGLRKVDFRHCSLKRARLGDAKLQGADFSGVNLSGANLKGADLRSAKFNGAILSDVDLKGVRIDTDAIKDCILSPNEDAIARVPELMKALAEAEAWAIGSTQPGGAAHIRLADMRPLGSALQNRKLPKSRFEDCRFIESDFSGSTLAGSQFIRCDLRGAQFAGCDLRGARFENCVLSFADFRSAQLGAIASGSGERLDVDFTGSSTVAAQFSAADRERLNLAETPGTNRAVG